MLQDHIAAIAQRVIRVVLVLSLVLGPNVGYAQSAFVGTLPDPGAMVSASPAFVPVLPRGLVIYPEEPLKFDFIVDSGNDLADQSLIKTATERLAKYFLAAVTVPEDQLWVNLSPYEKDRIIEDELGRTVLGRDMLAQDYLLKQLTASLIYPEKGLGKEFWARIYSEAQSKFGTTDIPVDTFNKVWIMPERAEVFEKGNAVYVTDAKLKVMLDSDYTAQTRAESQEARGEGAVAPSVFRDSSPVSRFPSQGSQELARNILREVVLPAIEREVNEGRNFAAIRQVYFAAILAKWYRELIQNTLLADSYMGKNRVVGTESDEKGLKEEIYQRYVAAYKKGVFDYIKEEPVTSDVRRQTSDELVPRKYFSGGISKFAMTALPLLRTLDPGAVQKSVTGSILRVGVQMDAVGSRTGEGFPEQEKISRPNSMRDPSGLLLEENGEAAMSVKGRVAVAVVTMAVLGAFILPTVYDRPQQSAEDAAQFGRPSIVDGTAARALVDRGLSFQAVGLEPDFNPVGTGGRSFINLYFKVRVTRGSPVPFGIAYLKASQGNELLSLQVMRMVKNDENDALYKEFGPIMRRVNYFYPDQDGRVQIPPSFPVVPVSLYQGDEILFKVQFDHRIPDSVELAFVRPGEGHSVFRMKDVMGPFIDKKTRQLKFLGAEQAMLQNAASVLSANMPDPEMAGEVLRWAQKPSVLTVAGTVTIAVAVALARGWWRKNTVWGNLGRLEKDPDLEGAINFLLEHYDSRAEAFLLNLLRQGKHIDRINHVLNRAGVDRDTLLQANIEALATDGKAAAIRFLGQAGDRRAIEPLVSLLPSLDYPQKVFSDTLLILRQLGVSEERIRFLDQQHFKRVFTQLPEWVRAVVGESKALDIYSRSGSLQLKKRETRRIKEVTYKGASSYPGEYGPSHVEITYGEYRSVKEDYYLSNILIKAGDFGEPIESLGEPVYAGNDWKDEDLGRFESDWMEAPKPYVTDIYPDGIPPVKGEVFPAESAMLQLTSAALADSLPDPTMVVEWLKAHPVIAVAGGLFVAGASFNVVKALWTHFTPSGRKFVVRHSDARWNRREIMTALIKAHPQEAIDVLERYDLEEYRQYPGLLQLRGDKFWQKMLKINRSSYGSLLQIAIEMEAPAGVLISLCQDDIRKLDISEGERESSAKFLSKYGDAYREQAIQAAFSWKEHAGSLGELLAQLGANKEDLVRAYRNDFSKWHYLDSYYYNVSTVKKAALFLEAMGDREANVMRLFLERMPLIMTRRIPEFFPVALKYFDEGYDFSIDYQPHKEHDDIVGYETAVVPMGYGSMEMGVEQQYPVYKTVVDQEERIAVLRGDRLEPVESAMQGGIDIKDIGLTYHSGSQGIAFDEDALREVVSADFMGFAPVILNITPVPSPLPLLGVALPDERDAQISSFFLEDGPVGREEELAEV